MVEAQADPPDREHRKTFALEPTLFRTEFSPGLPMVKVEQTAERSPPAIRKIARVNDLPGAGIHTLKQCVVHIIAHDLRVSARRVRWEAF